MYKTNVTLRSLTTQVVDDGNDQAAQRIIQSFGIY